MATDRGLKLTADEALAERFQREVVGRIQGTTLVLKSGLALVRAYRLNRYSKDLVFGTVRSTDTGRHF